MSLSEAATQVVAERLRHLESVRDHVVIDGDTHPSDPATYSEALRERIRQQPNYWQGRPISGADLVADMDRAGVDMALSWQNPAVLDSSTDHGRNYELLLGANRAIAGLAERWPTRIIPAGWTDPKALGPARAAELARICVEEFGFPVVKMNPAQNSYPIDDPWCRSWSIGSCPLARCRRSISAPTPPTRRPTAWAGSRRAIPLPRDRRAHGRRRRGLHGGRCAYTAARELGLRCPNLSYLLSAKRDVHMECDLIAYRAAGAPWRHNLAVASDAPYGRVVWNFGGFRAMFAALKRAEGHVADPRLAPGMFDQDTLRD